MAGQFGGVECVSGSHDQFSYERTYRYVFFVYLFCTKSLFSGNEVDQLFSILANEFKGDILTVDELKEKILNASGITPKPECRHLWYIFGWKAYITEHLSHVPLQNHSRFNSFSICFEDGIAKLRGKRLPQDSDFVPRAGLRLLKDGHTNSPVGAAEFRVEKIEFDKIFLRN